MVPGKDQMVGGRLACRVGRARVIDRGFGIVDEGMATSLTTTTLNKSTYAFFFNQRGLMGGIGLQGAKITRIQPPR